MSDSVEAIAPIHIPTIMIGPNNIEFDDLDDFYDEQGTEIFEELFEKDFDEVGFDPEYEDDSDEDAAKMYDY